MPKRIVRTMEEKAMWYDTHRKKPLATMELKAQKFDEINKRTGQEAGRWKEKNLVRFKEITTAYYERNKVEFNRKSSIYHKNRRLQQKQLELENQNTLGESLIQENQNTLGESLTQEN